MRPTVKRASQRLESQPGKRKDPESDKGRKALYDDEAGRE